MYIIGWGIVRGDLNDYCEILICIWFVFMIYVIYKILGCEELEGFLEII